MRLYILRHGKAERDSPSGRDEDRPLAERGAAQCRGLAELFVGKVPPGELRPRPAVVLSSRAARAEGTARVIGGALDLRVRHEDALSLHASFGDHLDLVERLLRAGEPALLVGHNPLLSRLIDHLAGAEELRTGELSVLELEAMDDAREVGRCRVDE